MIAKLLAGTVLALALLAAPAQAAPTNYVTLTDGVQIAVNVKVPPQCTGGHPVPGVLRDVRLRERVRRRQDAARRPRRRDRPAVAVPDRHARRARLARRRPLRDRARQPARHRVLVRRVRRLQLALGARRQGGHRQLDRQAAVVQRRRRDLRPLLQRPHRDDGRVDAAGPPRAVSASGLFGDMYRDIVYPGGVTNYGFPLLWTGAVRPVYDIGGGTGGGLFPPSDTSAQCAKNQAGRSRTILEDPLIHGLDDTDSEWYRVALAGLLRRQDRRAGPHHRRPTRTSRPVRAARPTSSTICRPRSPSGW